MSDNLKQRTAKGLFWGAMNSGTTQVLNLVIGLFLARCLSPADYGVVGVLTIFTAIAGDLQSSGFTQGLVNLKKPTERDYNAVFTFNVSMSITLYALLFLSAPLIAEYFHQPCLIDVSRFVFLGFLIASLGIAHGGYMTKNMMNREMAIIGAVALIVSGIVGITLALLGKTYWSLAYQQVTYITMINVGRYYYVREWRPRLTTHLEPVRKMFSFAIKILVTKIINSASANVLTVIIGRQFSIGQVGNFSQANKWNTMAYSLVANTVGQIAQAVLVESGTDADRERRVFSKMMRFTCFMTMPIMFGFALIARDFITLALGERWVGCVTMLQILCLSGAFMPLYTMFQNLAISKGRSDVYMWISIVQIVLQILVVLAFHDITDMVLAYSCFIICWLFVWQFFAGRLILYTFVDLFMDVMPFLFSAIIMVVCTKLATQYCPSLFIRIPLAALIYFLLMRVPKVDIMMECINYIKKKK